MSKPAKQKTTKDGSERVIGEDQFGVDIIDCPDFTFGKSLRCDQPDSSSNGKYWYVCPECGNTCWREVSGKTYYHKIACSESNGIGYNEERIEDINERLKAIKMGIPLHRLAVTK